jgi:sulfotransferase family protein
MTNLEPVADGVNKRMPPLPATRSQYVRFVAQAYVDGERNRRAFRDVERFSMYIGYARSGHTLVNSLLNAHPEIVSAHECQIFRFVGRRAIGRNQLYAMLLRRDEQFGELGRRWSGFDYTVPGQYQGRFESLRVIGDKCAGVSTWRIHREPSLLDRLRQVVDVPLRVIHVIRNPYDNIAAMARTRGLSNAVERYAELGRAADDIRNRLSHDELLDVRFEAFTADPGGSLAELCRFLDVDATEDYLNACSQLVKQGRRTRDTQDWNEPELAHVNELIAARPVLAGYTFDD